MLEKTSRDPILWFFLVLFILSLFLVGKLLWPFFSVIVLASVVSGLFYPVYKFFAKRFNETLSSILTCLLIFFTLFLPLLSFISVLVNEAHGFVQYANSPEISNSIKKFFINDQLFEKANGFLAGFNIHISYENISSTIGSIGKILGSFLLEQAKSIASHFMSLVINFCLMLLVSFYLLIDGNKLIWFIIDLSPLPDEQDKKLVDKFRDMAGAVLIGNGLSGIIQGVAGGLIFAICGLWSPFLCGVLMGFLAFLPIVGIAIVFVPALIYLLATGKIGYSIFLVVSYLILTGGIEYMLKPVVVGKHVKVHTLLVFLSIVGGLKMFGILGIIYGPLIITFFLTLTDIYNSSYRVFVENSNGT